MIGLGRSRLGPGGGQQGLQPRIFPVRHDLQTQTGQGPVESGQPRHVADGAHGGQIQPLADVRLDPALEQAPRPRLAVQRRQQDENHARRRQIALPRVAAGTVRIDHGETGRRLLAHHVVVDDHDVQTDGRSVGHGLVRRRSAVHGDDQIGASRLQRIESPRAGAIAFRQAVGDIDGQFRIQCAEPAHQQGRAGRPVHVIVGEDVDAAARLQGVDDGRRRRIHVHEAGRIGEQGPQRGPQEVLALIRRHAARGQSPRHRLIQIQRLHMGADGRRLGRALSPGAARQRARDVEEGGTVTTVSHGQSLFARPSFRDSVV
ncbi:hypothetical protein D3C72_913480 [compost metagenome]